MDDLKKNKILRVCNVDEEGRFGGPERRIIQVAKALKNRNVDTVILYPRLDSSVFAKNISKADVKGVPLSLTRLSKEKKILIRYILFFGIEIINMQRFFRKNRVHIVHINGSYQFKAALAARLSGCPVVWHLNDTYAPSLLKKVFSVIAKHCADGFIVAGQRVGAYYLKNTPLDNKPVQEIHAPVDMTLFDPCRFPQTDRSDVKNIVIGTVSGVNPGKGLEYFIDAAINVIHYCPNATFLVAGAILESQKRYYRMIKQKLYEFTNSNKIKFCGLVDDVPAFLSKLDICLFSSVAEASPTSIWEAMAMAKPIVTTDVGSINQHMKNGVSGFVVPVGDSISLAKRTLDLINQPDLRKKFGEEARKHAVRHLDINAAAEKHNEIYRRILQKNILDRSW